MNPDLQQPCESSFSGMAHSASRRHTQLQSLLRQQVDTFALGLRRNGQLLMQLG